MMINPTTQSLSRCAVLIVFLAVFHGNALPAGAVPIFTDNGDGTVSDAATGLVWQQSDSQNTGGRTWQGCIDYCTSLTLADQSVWRLPTYDELQSIAFSYDDDPHIDTRFFPDCLSDGYWSISDYAFGSNPYDPEKAWGVGFYYGGYYYGAKSDLLYVRCVRTMDAVSTTTTTLAATTSTTTTVTTTTTAALPTTTTSSVPDTPVTNPDLYTVRRNTILDVNAASGVLANDTGLNLTAFLDTGPGYGSLTLHEDGSFTYRPKSGFVGRDTFTYCVPDGVYSSPPETVAVDVRYVIVEPPKCPIEEVLGVDNPELEQLRAFRDRTLAQSAIGRALINIYYRNADRMTAALNRNPLLRAAARRVLEVAVLMAGRKE